MRILKNCQRIGFRFCKSKEILRDGNNAALRIIRLFNDMSQKILHQTIMRLDNRIPNAASCRSLELGMIRCLDEIAEQVRRSLNLSLTGAQIENVLRGSPDSMDDRVKAIIQREAGSYARRILSAIAEAGLDCRAMPVVFLGGGAGLMKRYLPQGSVLRPVILDDDKLNAQAYERLAGQVADHAG